MTPAVWSVYILRCGDGSLYTGVATDVARRLAAHRAGKGARYTRGRGPLRLVYVEVVGERGAALSREAAIKRLDRAAKLALLRHRGGGAPRRGPGAPRRRSGGARPRRR